MWPEGFIASLASDVKSKELINNVRPLGSLRSAARTTMPLASSEQLVEDDLTPSRKGAKEVGLKIFNQKGSREHEGWMISYNLRKSTEICG